MNSTIARSAVRCFPLLVLLAGCGAQDEATLAGEEADEAALLEIDATCPHKAILVSGLHPDASDRLRCLGLAAGDISQTIGDAPASAGYHAQDGTAGGHPYTAAVDIRTRGKTEAQLKTLLQNLGSSGFAAWYRKPGFDGWPSSEAPHIHAVYAGCAMKAALDGQVRDYRNGLNGLASHSHYSFWAAPKATREAVWALFDRFN